jgi:hypothetical protein
VRSTKSEIEAFRESPIWLDIVDELQSQIEAYKQELLSIPSDIAVNKPSTAEVLAHLGCMDGAIKSLDYIAKELLEVLIANYEEIVRLRKLGLSPEMKDNDTNISTGESN